VCGVTIIVGQGLKVIDKTEFKKLVDFCGVTSALLLIVQGVQKFAIDHQDSISTLEKIYNWLRKVDEYTAG
jgi:hypothetical protein